MSPTMLHEVEMARQRPTKASTTSSFFSHKHHSERSMALANSHKVVLVDQGPECCRVRKQAQQLRGMFARSTLVELKDGAAR